MAFYVKLGPRGLIFRLGTWWIGVIGRVVYWRSCRKRMQSPHPHPTLSRVGPRIAD